MELSDVVDYRLLAKTKGQSISVSITYIAFLTKLQKRQVPEKRFALIEKRYHNNLGPLISTCSLQIFKYG